MNEYQKAIQKLEQAKTLVHQATQIASRAANRDYPDNDWVRLFELTTESACNSVEVAAGFINQL